MKLGKFTIDILDTGIFYLDGGAMFGVVPKALWSKAYDKGDEFNRIPLSARPLLICWDNHIALVDTANGTKLDPKIADRFSIDIQKNNLELILAKYKLNASDITDVFLTHLHFDHSGGATKIENNNIVPTFPNAKYFVQKSQYNWAINPSEKDRASFFNENYVPLYDQGILHFLDGDVDIYDGISTITVNGHTKGMQLIKISDNNQTALYMADLCPTSSHIPLPFVMGYDNEPLETIKEKKNIFPKAVEENWTLIYEHDAYKQATKIIKTEKGFKAGKEITISESLNG